MRINRRACGLAVAACLAMTATACGGEGGEEAVFLYFINGYPGTSSMSVSASTGTLVTNVPFGERYGASGSCGPDAEQCPPLRVERQIDTDFTVRIENMTEPAEISKDLFAMYPHETGTLVMTRRNGESDVDTTLLRHTQSIDEFCALTFVNGLSVTNEYLSSGGTYSIAPEFFIEDIARAGFADEANTPFLSECGALPVDDPTHTNLLRPQVIQAVRDNPWFLTVETEGFLELRWNVASPDTNGGRGYIHDSGAFLSVLTSREYFECIQGAISIRQPEDAMMMPGFGATEPDCPETGVTWADVDVDAQAVAACNQPINRTTQMQDPAQIDSPRTIFGSGICDARFRIRNEGPTIVFGPEGNDELGSHGDGAPVDSEVSIPDGSQRFWVLLGRPVNPIVWQWDSAETFVDLSVYPYFNEGGDRPVVGDTDR